jgi:anti-sigma regulatory factor (Ser/Thr protein kinase)
MLLLLGDQLIKDAGIAVFELVKNAYDADSPSATVTMHSPDDATLGKIVIEDSGTGMDFETVTKVWLEPGTDYRVRQREEGIRTPRFGRLPLGEKGVGRFAAHKLGKQISLVSRKRGQPEVAVLVNWQKFESKKYLSDVAVNVTERQPEIFHGSKTGTRIEITQLRESWDRGMVRNLARSINSICSPFEEEGEFRANLVLPNNQEWLKGLLSIDNVLDYALFRAQCDLDGIHLTYTYRFTPPPAMESKVKPRVVQRSGKNSPNISVDGRLIDLDANHVGPVHIDLYIFDRDPKMLQLAEVSDKKGLKEFLNQSGGIRVYRDGIRVYDYGEPGNDWLNLGGQRVNWPTQRISNNLVLGAVALNLASSLDLKNNRGLIEKTNREGFVENPAARDFRDAVTFAIAQIEVERNEDKVHIRNVYSSKKLREPVLEDLAELREAVEKKHLTSALGSYLDRIETDFMTIRDRFLTSASAGLSLSVVIHEVEKGVAELLNAVEREKATPRVKALAKHLADLIEGFGSLIRRSGQTREKASSLIAQALFNIEFRLRLHGIEVTNESLKADFDVKCSRRLVIATIMNLIDNSIWWLENKWGSVANKKRIYVGTTSDLPDGPAIVIVDNGPGFLDPPEYLIEPFITRKPDGMGLGLHVADQVMKVQSGKLEFPEVGDLDLPKEFDGAAVALVFQRKGAN